MTKVVQKVYLTKIPLVSSTYFVSDDDKAEYEKLTNGDKDKFHSVPDYDTKIYAIWGKPNDKCVITLDYNGGSDSKGNQKSYPWLTMVRDLLNRLETTNQTWISILRMEIGKI